MIRLSGVRWQFAPLMFCLTFAIAMVAQGRELHWKELDVVARLEADGTLRVRERHAMIFSGDWNGGEREFDVRPGQALQVERIFRVDPESGSRIPLEEGSLDAIDHWAWANESTIRWRSRRPDDPPFSNTRIDYVIEYSLTGGLVPKLDGGYRLRHDFAFPERPGAIEAFRLDLAIDPAWRITKGRAGSMTAGPLRPGRRHVVEMHVAGGSLPPPALADVLRHHRRIVWTAAWIGGAVLVMVFLVVAFRFREKRLGRFDSPQSETVDWTSVERDILPVRAEVAAALHDEKVAEPAVAALLARLTAEGKIRSQSRKKVLKMELAEGIETFAGYERALLDALFCGETKTDTNKVRNHYRRTGFEPVGTIGDGVAAEVERLADEPLRRPSMFRPAGKVALFGAVAAIVLAFVRLPSGANSPLLFGVIVGGIVLFFLGALDMMKAEAWRKRESSELKELSLRAPFAALAFAAAAAFLDPASVADAATAAASLTAVASVAMTLAFAATTAGPGVRSWRNRMRATRAFLEREIASGTTFEERFLPLLVALRLADSKSLAVAAPTPVSSTGDDDDRRGFDSSTLISEPSRSTFGGGGGAFGGAGATGGWAAAAAGLAGGVAAARVTASDSGSSSSSSSGSSSSSSSDSGGGGGGGW